MTSERIAELRALCERMKGPDYDALEGAARALPEALDAIESLGKNALGLMKKAGAAITESGEIGLRAIEAIERVHALCEKSAQGAASFALAPHSETGAVVRVADVLAALEGKT